VLLGGSLVCLFVGYGVAWLMGVRGNRTGAFVQASFRGNLAFIGVPVVVYSLGNGNGDAVALGLLLLAGMVPFFNIAAVLVLLAGQHRFNLRAVGTVLKKLVTNPLILSCVVGLALAGLGWPLPAMVERTLQPLGRMALPLALLSIGASLDLGKVHGDVAPILAASLIKVGVAPLAGWALGRLVGLSGLEMSVILILLACPTAAATYVLADQLGADTQLSAGVIVASTLLSFASLFIVLWL
jgi:predicted permease